VLAKIYGFFKIGYRNAVTGRSMRMNVLIMENLFYDRRFSKVSLMTFSPRHVLKLRSMTSKVVLETD
jgi:1-phosphatidylinositol-3-phosphate 5-kinase